MIDAPRCAEAVDLEKGMAESSSNVPATFKLEAPIMSFIKGGSQRSLEEGKIALLEQLWCSATKAKAKEQGSSAFLND